MTREVWEAVNTSWMTLGALLKRQVREDDLPDVLAAIRRQNGQVRGALNGTMLRNDGFHFAQLGTFLERADNIARILDVKYYLLLPSVAHIGGSIDNVQWETILRSVSAHRAYRWLYGTEISALKIAESTTGFLYYVSIAGLTGERRDLPPELVENVGWLRSKTDLPICIGFGISTPEHVRQLAPVADGLIVGSALVRRLAEIGNRPKMEVVHEIGQVVAELADALKP